MADERPETLALVSFALLSTLFGWLRSKGLADTEDLKQIVDHTLLALETTQANAGRHTQSSIEGRAILERMIRELAQPKGR